MITGYYCTYIFSDEELRSNFSDFRDLGYLCCRENGVPYHRSFAGPAFKRLLKSCGVAFLKENICNSLSRIRD